MFGIHLALTLLLYLSRNASPHLPCGIGEGNIFWHDAAAAWLITELELKTPLSGQPASISSQRPNPLYPFIKHFREHRSVGQWFQRFCSTNNGRGCFGEPIWLIGIFLFMSCLVMQIMELDWTSRQSQREKASKEQKKWSLAVQTPEVKSANKSKLSKINLQIKTLTVTPFPSIYVYWSTSYECGWRSLAVPGGSLTTECQ